MVIPLTTLAQSKLSDSLISVNLQKVEMRWHLKRRIHFAARYLMNRISNFYALTLAFFRRFADSLENKVPKPKAKPEPTTVIGSGTPAAS